MLCVCCPQKYSPAAAALPTTNGPWATGDGIELGTGVGAALVGMEHVQVHPTGFVDPGDPTAGTKVMNTKSHVWCLCSAGSAGACCVFVNAVLLQIITVITG